MAPWTSYKLLEGDEANGDIPKRKRWLLECLQPLNLFIRWTDEHTQSIRKRLRQLTEPFDLIFARYGTRKIIWTAFIALLILVVLLATFNTAFEEIDVLEYVDPLIGTAAGGHVFAGATLPFGMAKPVADVEDEGMAGFSSEGSRVFGFSHLHDSGTGGSPSMGTFPIFVHPRCEGDDIMNCELRKTFRAQFYLPASVVATPGFFSIDLESGVHAEMTATQHAALYRFSFPNDIGTLSPVITADASDLLNSFGARALSVDPKTGRMTGEGSFEPSFGRGRYQSYFCADFRGAVLQDFGGFNDTIFPGVSKVGGSGSFADIYEGVYARFSNVRPGDQIVARVGLSFRSSPRACENAELEVQDWNFDRVHEDAANTWRTKLEPIKVSSKGVAHAHLRNFWSGIYRAFLSPQDYTGENQLWNSTEPYYDSWYCIWDTFRGVHPFFTLVDPVSQSRMVRSLIDIQQHEGWLPDCRMSFCKGFTQGGSNADVILADSLIKNVPGINWTAAYDAVVKDAEEQPKNWDLEGRGGIKSWKEVGYIPYHDADSGGLRTRSISRTFEYAYNDFVIAEMANITHRPDDYEKYSKRASNWKNLFREDHESYGFANFPQPRLHNGSWGFQNASLCSPINNFHSCYLDYSGHETYEGSPWLYQFYVPQDMAGLINLLGGRASFIRRLDKLHDGGLLDMGDEQAFLTAFLYHYAGRPDLSIKRVHSYIPRLFNDTVAGIPGNDDSGSMGTFTFFSMLGVFPNAGQSVYLIIPPFFESVSITNPQTKKTATIKNVNFDPAYKRIYVKSAKLNGVPHTKNWLNHSFFAEGGTLELTLTDKQTAWGTHEDDVPPSLSTGLFVG